MKRGAFTDHPLDNPDYVNMLNGDYASRPDQCWAHPGTQGWAFWRCERSRWHLGRHRFRNYTWGRVLRRRMRFDPVPPQLKRAA